MDPKMFPKMSPKMSPPFTVIICHGSYHTPAPYAPFQSLLQHHGIPSHCPQLPTSSPTLLHTDDPSNPDFDRAPPPSGYPQQADDVAVIDALVQKLVTQDHENVVLLGHSSGGFTTTAAAVPEYQARNRAVGTGGIVGIFYAAAFLVPVGESVHGFFQPKDGAAAVVPEWCRFHKHGMEGLASVVDGAEYFFNGLGKEEAERYAAGLTASPVLKTVLENDAYGALPCVYLVTEDDLVLPMAYQEGMVALMNQRPGVDIGVRRCPSGHSPHLAWIDGLVDEVERFGRAVLG